MFFDFQPLASRLDSHEMRQLEPSQCTKLDIVGMQPHAREYLETQYTYKRSEREFECFDGQTIDYTEGIQFSGTP